MPLEWAWKASDAARDDSLLSSGIPLMFHHLEEVPEMPLPTHRGVDGCQEGAGRCLSSANTASILQQCMQCLHRAPRALGPAAPVNISACKGMYS